MTGCGTRNIPIAVSQRLTLSDTEMAMIAFNPESAGSDLCYTKYLGGAKPIRGSQSQLDEPATLNRKMLPEVEKSPGIA